MFSLSSPFIIETSESDVLETRAALIAPNVVRRRLHAANGDIIVCDLAVGTPEFHALVPLLGNAPVQELDVTALAPLANDLVCARHGGLDAAAAHDLFQRVVLQISGQRSSLPQIPQRLARVFQLIQEKPLYASNFAQLAEQVGLSPTRLRHLFRERTGISLSQYSRWNAVWKAIWQWSCGQSWTRQACAAGFHDFAHFNRALNEMFGINPSILSDAEQVLLIRGE
jgi:AraC-like DNA-binding protein